MSAAEVESRPLPGRPGAAASAFAAALVLAAVLATVVWLAGAARTPSRAGIPSLVRLSLPLSPEVAALPAASAVGRRFGWPLRPFDRPHALRGGFGDPRFGAVQRNFHFGIDIPAAGGTPVYAVAAGTAYLAPDRVALLSGRRGRSGFSYWHVLPAVRNGALVRWHQLVGWVNPLWGHLHLAELDRGRWVNPLLGLQPRPAPGRSAVDSVSVIRSPRGALDVVVDAYSLPAQPPPTPWRGARLAPALVRWRVLGPTLPLSGWRTALDLRTFLPPQRLFSQVYAPGTMPNTPGRPGTFRFYLARGWRPPAGRYTIEVQAAALGGPDATAEAPLVVDATGTTAAKPQPAGHAYVREMASSEGARRCAIASPCSRH